MNLKRLQGQRIKAVRLQRGLSQETVAYDLSITQPTLARIENGKSNISFGRLYQLASYFNMSIKDLVVDQIDIQAAGDHPESYVFFSGAAKDELLKRISQLESQLNDKQKIIKLLEKELKTCKEVAT